MATRRTSAYFAAKFITGYVPTQADFEDLWASVAWRTEDNTMVNGAQFIDASNAGNLIQIGGGGTSNILIRSGGAQITTDDSAGYTLQADANNSITQTPGGTLTFTDESSANLETPQISMDVSSADWGSGLAQFRNTGAGITLPQGTNSMVCTGNLSGGTVTVANTYVRTGAVIVPIWNGSGTLTGALKQGAIVNLTSFVFASSIGTDSAHLVFIIFNPPH